MKKLWIIGMLATGKSVQDIAQETGMPEEDIASIALTTAETILAVQQAMKDEATI